MSLSILQKWWYEAVAILAFVIVAGALLYFAARRINAATLDIVAAAEAEGRDAEERRPSYAAK